MNPLTMIGAYTVYDYVRILSQKSVSVVNYFFRNGLSKVVFDCLGIAVLSRYHQKHISRSFCSIWIISDGKTFTKISNTSTESRFIKILILVVICKLLRKNYWHKENAFLMHYCFLEKNQQQYTALKSQQKKSLTFNVFQIIAKFWFKTKELYYKIAFRGSISLRHTFICWFYNLVRKRLIASSPVYFFRKPAWELFLASHN